jgi:hypothetical protein
MAVGPTGLAQKTGSQVAHELGGRRLLRYVPGPHAPYGSGSSDPHWATPTAYAPSETLTWLALPGTAPREYVWLIDPAQVPDIWGPREVFGGHGVEYYLPDGFPASALALPWPILVD